MSSPQIKQGLGQHFGTKWFLANTLGYGLGMALPLLLGDLLLADNYNGYGTVAFLSFGLWAGTAQWAVLRRVIPVSLEWIFTISMATVFSVLPALFLFAFPAVALLLSAVTFPLLSSFLQWRLLRRKLKPVRLWMVVGSVATAIAIVTGLLFGTICATTITQQPGIVALSGGLSYGCVYGAITYLGLLRLTQRASTLPDSQTQSGLDTPPNANASTFALLSMTTLIVIWGAWVVAIPPLSTAAGASLGALPIWLLFGVIVIPLLVYSYLSIAIHELGHLCLALLCGFDLKSLAVDRWVMTRRGKGWRVVRTKKRFAGGFVLPVPRTLATFNQRSLFWMILGGPLASFLLFGVGAALLLIPGLVSNHLWAWGLVAVSGLNLHIAIFNCLPIGMGYLKTDGRRLLDLIKNNTQGQRFYGLYCVQASLKQGIRPREIDPALIEKTLLIPEESMDHVSGLIGAYSSALDKGDFEKAGDYLDQALVMNLHYPEIFRGLLLLEGAYFEGFIRHQADEALRWFEKMPETALIPPYSLLRAEAALRLAQGDNRAAVEKAEAGLANVQRDRFMKGSALAEEEQLFALLEAAKGAV